MSLIRLAVVLCMSLLCLDCREAADAIIPIEDPYPHGKAASITLLAADEAKKLIDARVKYNSSSLDRAIMELSALVCGDVPEGERKQLMSLSVDRLYPLERWAVCEVVVCGGCYGSHGYSWGPGVRTRPSVDQ